MKKVNNDMLCLRLYQVKKTRIPDIFVDAAIVAGIFGIFYGLIFTIYVFG